MQRSVVSGSGQPLEFQRKISLTPSLRDHDDAKLGGKENEIH